MVLASSPIFQLYLCKTKTKPKIFNGQQYLGISGAGQCDSLTAALCIAAPTISCKSVSKKDKKNEVIILPLPSAFLSFEKYFFIKYLLFSTLLTHMPSAFLVSPTLLEDAFFKANCLMMQLQRAKLFPTCYRCLFI